MTRRTHVREAVEVLKALGMPRGQQNERTALCLLALLDLVRDRAWHDAQSPLVGITPIMDFAKTHYGRKYAPNTRESFRRRSMHQLVQAGISRCNPNESARSTNSQDTVYQICPTALDLLRTYGEPAWAVELAAYLKTNKPLAERYANERKMVFVPVRLSTEQEISLSPGKHNALVKAIVEQLVPRFVPGGLLVYVGDTSAKWGHFDRSTLAKLGMTLDEHGKMPDVVVHYPAKNWLVLIESVTSHGPVDSKRHEELAKLFAPSTAGLVYVTAFSTRSLMKRYLGEIAWETEAWVAESPTHMIHFNGSRFLGPYE